MLCRLEFSLFVDFFEGFIKPEKRMLSLKSLKLTLKNSNSGLGSGFFLDRKVPLNKDGVKRKTLRMSVEF
jgi:hypothetical protein